VCKVVPVPDDRRDGGESAGADDGQLLGEARRRGRPESLSHRARACGALPPISRRAVDLDDDLLACPTADAPATDLLPATDA
jgi:hypothetical protein